MLSLNFPRNAENYRARKSGFSGNIQGKDIPPFFFKKNLKNTLHYIILCVTKDMRNHIDPKKKNASRQLGITG